MDRVRKRRKNCVVYVETMDGGLRIVESAIDISWSMIAEGVTTQDAPPDVLTADASLRHVWWPYGRRNRHRQRAGINRIDR